MKKQIEGIKSKIRNYIDTCKERDLKRLYKSNWKGLINIINSSVHRIDNENSLEGHYKRSILKEELVEYSIKYLKDGF